MVHTLRRTVTILGLAVWFLTATAVAAEGGRCAKCGMALAGHGHTRFELVLADGTRAVTCGVQCGLMLARSRGVQRAWATDFISGKRIDATRAWYVVGSAAVPDMAPGLIAFASREDAERFRQGFGGRVLDWEAARKASEGPMGAGLGHRSR
ncbi:nitrous oxide reductase accessory protein NosL [Deferrisoma camini]|uniref:nitrous oxide reductase accessory protein NosL n=1 Tax=Deferrisoma camini TaxID=1035120 RepID=UPI00046CF96E|nr:nitrous oxide reductase accessory protein NosL [Deferrisoma camini]